MRYTQWTKHIFELAIAGQREDAAEPSDLSPECNTIRQKLTKNMNILENVANTAQGIQQKDCK